MPTIAYHTLGCKVNQYDTQAMLELFLSAGYTTVPMEGSADVFLINTCTVTGTGDKKSLQLARRIRREHPASKLILCGCLAQKQGEALLETGADLVLGTQNRSRVVSLLESVVRSGRPLCAVEPLTNQVPFESLQISSQDEHTRAVLKIQEGCENRCTYCIIPSVRGPVRSRPLDEIVTEAARLCENGYREIVLTGIHLSSYGRDLPGKPSLLDVVRLLQGVSGILRIRLGSLEPNIATADFAAALQRTDKICPQFHLALQSGSDSVLRRMKRRYNTDQYRNGVRNLRAVFPHAALTTDIMTGFPGETEEEFRASCRLVDEIGFARIHVFPYSPRPDTPASEMNGQLPRGVKEERARELIRIGRLSAARYLESWIGLDTLLLPEEQVNGCWEGYTPEYIRVRLPKEASCTCGRPVRVRLLTISSGRMAGEIIDDRKDLK